MADVAPLQAERRMTPRRVFVIIAIVLALTLVALGVYLFWFLGRPEVLTGEPARAGIQPIWQVFGPGEGDLPRFDRPMSIAVGARDRVYVTDARNDRVCVFDPAGRFLFEFGATGIAKPAPGVKATYAAGTLNFPVGIDTDGDGNVYVASLYNDSIEVFTSEGDPLRRFPDPLVVTGAGGSGAYGTGIAVTAIAVHDDRVWVTDTYQVLAFTLEGELITQWGRPGTASADLDHPNGIAVSDDGETIYISDSNHNRVTAFTPEGEVIWQVGHIASGIQDPSERIFDLPRGITVLADDSILVVDALRSDLVHLSADGTLIGRYGERGTLPGQMNFANDVTTLRGFILLADKGGDRLQMVRLTY
jgi:DNA-binding beta-propeller fold protein YncE